MTDTEYNAAYQALNDRCKAGEITTDQLVLERRALQAQRTQAQDAAREATSEHELQMRLNAQDDRVKMLERKAKAHHVPAEVMVTALALLDASKRLQDQAARMLAVR